MWVDRRQVCHITTYWEWKPIPKKKKKTEEIEKETATVTETETLWTESSFWDKMLRIGLLKWQKHQQQQTSEKWL